MTSDMRWTLVCLQILIMLLSFWWLDGDAR